jgi:PilZ domain
MLLVERRFNFRHLLQVRVVFQTPQMSSAIVSKTLDISNLGIFLVSPRKLQLQSTVLLSLRVPTEISGSAFGELHCEGRVVHERVTSSGEFGYGISIRSVDPLRGARHVLSNPCVPDQIVPHPAADDSLYLGHIGSPVPLRLRVPTAPIPRTCFLLEQKQPASLDVDPTSSGSLVGTAF